MQNIRLYTKSYCPYCDRAKAFFVHKGLSYSEIDIENDAALAEKLFTQTGFRTVPQIFIGERCIGGYDDMIELEKKGLFDALVRGE